MDGEKRIRTTWFVHDRLIDCIKLAREVAGDRDDNDPSSVLLRQLHHAKGSADVLIDHLEKAKK